MITFGSSNPETAKAGLKDLIDTALQFKEFLPEEFRTIVDELSFDYIATADIVGLAISTESPMLQAMVLSVITIVLQIVKKDTAGSVSVEVGFKNDIASMIKHVKDGIRKKPGEEFLEGFLLEANAKLSPLLLAYGRNIYYQEEIGKSWKKPGQDGELMPMLIRGSKVSVELSEIQGEKLHAILKDMGVPVDQVPAIADLVDMGKMMGLSQMVEGIPQAKMALDFFREHIKAHVHVTARVKKIIATAHFKTQGIKEAVDLVLGN